MDSQVPIVLLEHIKPITNKKFSAGIIAIYKTSVLLVRGRQTHIWSFPKGHSKCNETPFDTAKREFYEETGVKITDKILPHIRVNKKYYFIKQYNTSERKYMRLRPVDTYEVDKTNWILFNKLCSFSVNKDVTMTNSKIFKNKK